MKRTLAAIGWLAVAAGLPGCTQSPPATNAAVEAVKSEQEWESWEIDLLQGTRAGYSHVTARRAVESGREVLRTEYVSHLTLRRGNEPSSPESRLVSVETPDGKLLRFETETRMGP